jgi:peptide/nickel transport system permease protein
MASVWEADIYDPELGYDIEAVPHPSKPSLKHPLGTDGSGRDVLSRLAAATGTSFGVGLVAAVVGTLVGTAVGTTAAFYGGKVDTVLMTMSDAFILLPPAVVLLVIGFIFEMSWLYVGLLFGSFAGLGSFALIMKSHASSVNSSQYVDSGRVAGGGNWRIMRVHVLPNLVAVIIVNMMFIATGAVMVEALLSYLGRTEFRLSWGTMIWTAQDDLSSFAYGENLHVLIPPALAIMLFCGAFYLIGRSLEEVINPRLRSR